MSRFEGDFAAAGSGRLGDGEVHDLLGAFSSGHDEGRQAAIACYLSASEGWNEAMRALRGTFASDAAEAVRMSRATPNKRGVNQRASEYLQWQALKPAGTDND